MSAADGMTIIVLQKGGGKGGSSSSTYVPVEDTNSLTSNARVRLLEILGEGPIKGLATDGPNWGQSVFLDTTPIQAPDGTFNFNIFESHFRYGLPDDDPIPGFPTQESEFNVGEQVTHGRPVIRRISNDLSAVRIRFRLSSAFSQTTKGDVVGASCGWGVDFRDAGGGGDFVRMYGEFILGKTMSPFEHAVRVNIPAGVGPWDVRVVRDSPDDANSATHSESFWAGYTEIVDGQLAYSDTVCAAMAIDAQDIPNVPLRSYLIDGLIVDVPSNYDPVARTYAGDWDGTFKAAFTNNTAWVLWDVIVNPRYGLGADLHDQVPDKWSFYEAAQRNDEMVDDGKGGLEPRYTFNGLINVQKAAYDVCNAIAAAMDCLLFNSGGVITLVQDRPATDVERYLSNADVVEGEFDYQGAPLDTRWTSVIVQYVDPTDNYRPAPAYVIDPTLLSQQGKRETTLPAMGCTSNAQAIRAGRRIIYTNQYETEVVTFQTPIDFADMRPGMVVGISDAKRVGARLGGRVLSVDPASGRVTLDAPVQGLAVGMLFVFTVGATPFERHVASLVDPTTITLDAAVPGLDGGARFLALPTTAVPRTWRIISVGEREKFVYEFTAVQYQAEKWAYVDRFITIPLPPYSLLPTGDIKPPTSVTVLEHIYLDTSGAPNAGASISWSGAPDARVVSYKAELRDLGNDMQTVLTANVGSLSIDYAPLRQSSYRFTLTAVDSLGRRSPSVVLDFTTVGLTAKPLPPVAFNAVPSGSAVFMSWIPTQEIDVKYYWLKYARAVDGSATWERATTIASNITRSTTQFSVPGRVGTYFIKTVDSIGQESDTALSETIIANVWAQNAVEIVEPAPSWLGYAPPFSVEAGLLKLGPPLAPEPVPPEIFPGDRDISINAQPTRYGVYTYAPASIDLRVNSTVSLTSQLVAWGVLGETVMAAWIPLASAVPLAGAWSSNWEAHIEIAIMPEGGVWSAYKRVLAADAIARYVAVRILVLIYDLVTVVNIESGRVVIDVPDRTERGSNVAITGTLIVPFAETFHQNPAVALTTRNASATAQLILVSTGVGSFTVRAQTTAGVDATTTFDWQASGF